MGAFCPLADNNNNSRKGKIKKRPRRLQRCDRELGALWLETDRQMAGTMLPAVTILEVQAKNRAPILRLSVIFLEQGEDCALATT